MAESLRDHNSPDEVEVYLLDGIPGEDKFQRSIVETGYMYVSARYPKLWTGIYEGSKLKPIMHLQTAPMTNHSWQHILEFIEEKQITRIVILHFLLIRSVARIIRRTGRRIPVVTIVTDPFTVHPIWFFFQFTRVIVFSAEAKKTAVIRYRYPPDLIKILPPVLNRKYNQPLAPDRIATLKDEFGFRRNRRLILIVGGGEGLPDGELYLKAILNSGADVDIAFVCGKNQQLKKAVVDVSARFPARDVKIYGFVDFMYELMNMADIVITKAGPATVLEALILDKPLIITRYSYGQERGNVDFVVRHRLGYYIHEPKSVARKVAELSENADAYQRLVCRVRNAEIRNGTEAIADYLLTFDKSTPA